MDTQTEKLPESEEIYSCIEEVVDSMRQINSEVDSYDVRELLDYGNQERTNDELMEMHNIEGDAMEIMIENWVTNVEHLRSSEVT
ncbi:hypothetical protein TNCV_2709561 [Trichonephila clavipes]|nr:hypothetical protein TNCV_2709561 [Trichonephila clavipes]